MADLRPGVHFQTGTTTSPPLLLLLLLPLLPLPSLTVAKPPHIVVFMADDMGWGDIGKRDSQLYTPTIDKLVDSGVTLKYSYMQEGGIPSRAAFFSGYYPVHLGLQHAAISPSQEAVLPLNVRILPQDLKELGYSTHYVGKWHLGSNSTEYTPTRRGFDTFYGIYGGEADYYTHTTPSGVYDMHNNVGQQFSVDTSANGTYSTTLFTDKTIDIIKNHDKTKPLFLVVAYQAVHKPLQSPGQFNSKCSSTNSTRKTRCTKLAAMDQGIRKIQKWLKKRKLLSKLITLFISDNGGPVEEGSSNLPLQGSKGTLWEGGTRAVTILHSKKYLKKSFTWNGLMHAVDWYPTILGMAGVEKELIQIDGVNNWPKISNNQESERWEFLVGWNDATQNYAYRYDSFKLLKFPSNNKTDDSYDYLLFDIDKFPNETRDLSDRSNKQCLMKMMKLKLESFKARLLPAL